MANMQPDLGQPIPRARAALVTTLRGAAPVLESFLRYHLGIGFARIYLFFDDPADAGIEIARRFEHAGVRIALRGPELDEAWRRCVQYAYFAPHVETEVMSRQCLNVEVAVQQALAAGDDWLLHIDADELFYCPGQDVGAHFARLTALGIDRAVYPNVEAIAETIEVGDYFRDVTLFKINRNTLPGGRFNAVQAALASRFRQFPDNFFLFYSNGKSAARVVPGLVPDGVHRFGARLFLRPGQQPPQLRAPLRERIIADCRILHYACCGYANFRDKYRILGTFADRWFDRVDIRGSIGDFHLAARDVVATGDDERGREFYRGRAVIDDPEAVAALVEAGLLRRIAGPSQWLTGQTDTLP